MARNYCVLNVIVLCSSPAPRDGIFHNLFQGKTDSFLGHEAAVQVSGLSSLRGNKELVHFKLDNENVGARKGKKSDILSVSQKTNPIAIKIKSKH